MTPGAGPRLLDDPIARSRMMLNAARWAAAQFRRFDRATVTVIVDAVAKAAYEQSGAYAEWAVNETGFGVAKDKKIKNEIASLGIAQYYRNLDLITPRVDASRRIVEIPKPAGVIVGLAPSTNPVSTLYFKVVLALMTRNAIIISPHPLAKECCVAAAKMLAAVAERAGAPADVIQIIDDPSIPLVESLMSDAATNVILATGGSGMVRAAYRSGNPAIGVGPGNAPVVVDATADLAATARLLVDSKSFDNSLLCSSESVLIAEQRIAMGLVAQLKRQGAHVCTADERDRLRAYLFPDGHLNTEAVGKDAGRIARAVGLRVAASTRALIAPIDLIVAEEALAGEKMCPVLSMNTQPDFSSTVRAARAVLRVAGAGHSAAIHSNDPHHVVAFASAVDVLRVVVNAPNSTGVAGFDTNLAPTMTVGTGFAGRSSLGENLGPQHLVNWSKVAYTKDPRATFPDFAELRPWERDTLEEESMVSGRPTGGSSTVDISAELRESIRRMIVEELRDVVEMS